MESEDERIVRNVINEVCLTSPVFGRMAMEAFDRIAAQHKWQPIETAPKDGTCFDSWVDGQRVPNTYCELESSSFMEAPYGTWFYNQPTHWMPPPLTHRRNEMKTQTTPTILFRRAKSLAAKMRKSGQYSAVEIFMALEKAYCDGYREGTEDERRMRILDAEERETRWTS